MALVFPFRGLRYNAQKISDIASVTSLPYDVLSSQDREDLYRASPHNIVRLIWGKDLPGDGPQENQYLRAARLLQEWQEWEFLIRDDRQAFYLYAQDFPLGQRGLRSRRGIIARVRFEEGDFDPILRHEFVFPEPMADRLNLLRATRANLDPIFTLYEGKGRVRDILDEKMKVAPLLDFSDRAGLRQRLWTLRDPISQEKIQRELSDRPLFIADGHHRYEAALRYRKERMDAGSDFPQRDEGYHSIMMMLIDLEDPGMVILPVHRLIGRVRGWELGGFLEKAGAFFSWEELRLPGGDEERMHFIEDSLGQGENPHRFGLYAGGGSLFLLALKEDKGDVLEELIPSPVLRDLDVSILNHLILREILGLRDLEPKVEMRYTSHVDEALKEVENGTFSLAILLRPTSLQDVKRVSLAGQRMPQKSTFFYPKLLSGLVINMLDN